MPTTVTDYTALLSGSYWNGIEVTGKPVFVTYSFPTTAPAAQVEIVGNPAFGTFQTFNPDAQALAHQALDAWSNVSGIKFIEVAPGQGQINFSMYDFSSISWAQFAGGIAYYPFGDWNGATFPYFTDDWANSGDVFMNSDYAPGGVPNLGTLTHEIGHALGFKHPFETVNSVTTVHDQTLPGAMDNTANTIMSYNGTSTALGPLDIAAVQAVYGAAGSQGTQDQSWSWNATYQILTQNDFNTDDVMRGISGRDKLNGNNGNDKIFALGDNDTVMAGAGNDTVYAGSGNDSVVGGAGDDWLYGGPGLDTISYSDATTSVTVNLLFGSGSGMGNDVLFEFENVIGGSAGDSIIGDNNVNSLQGGAGNDTITGNGGSDAINGGDGNDLILFSNNALAEGFDKITGDAGLDTIQAGQDNTYISLASVSGIETISSGGFANVRIKGSNAGENWDFSGTTLNGIVSIDASKGNDTVVGSGAADTISGQEGNDSINGGIGNDKITGGVGVDTLTGGTGVDRFVFGPGESTVATPDLITDFSHAEKDRIDVSKIDANPTITGDQMFSFIVNAAFGHHAGELHYTTAGGITSVSGDINGDAVADFQINLTGTLALVAGDFYL